MEDMDLVAKVKNKPYDKEKWIYLQSEDMKNRYLLGTTGKKTLVCCGVNPSYASPEDLDPTMKNVEKFARKYEYDSYVMINLYPMRATKPKNMHEIMDTSIAEKNYQYIENLLKSGNCDIWAAWGTIIETRTYLKECLARIVKMADKYNSTWYTIGQVSKKGHPHHPLYLGKDSERAVFDVHKYLNLL